MAEYMPAVGGAQMGRLLGVQQRREPAFDCD